MADPLTPLTPFLTPLTPVCYALMQAVGMVDDHSPECFKSEKKSTTRRTP